MRMEPFDKQEWQLSDRELDNLLPEWKVPTAPARLRAAIFPEEAKPWWRRLWSASIRIPAPVACCLAALLALDGWRWMAPGAERVVVKTERVEVPVVKTEVVTRTVYRDRIVRTPTAGPARDIQALQPVAELRPRIIRSGHVQN
jgi:hypothetical protein